MRKWLFCSGFVYLIHIVYAQSCESEYERWDGSKCICKSGFYGKDCLMCTSDEVCANDIKNSDVCIDSLTYYDDTEVKTYDCSLDPSLQSLFPDGEVSIQCLPLNHSCVFALFKIKDTIYGEHMIDCHMSGCEFKNASTDVHCDLINCVCGPSCSAITKSIVESSFSNKPIDVEVTKRHVKLNIKDAVMQLSADCNSTACGLSGDPSGSGSGSDSKVSGFVEGAIAIVLMLVCFVVCGAGCCGIVQKRIESHVHEDPTEDDAYAKDKTGKTLSFHNVCSHVNLPMPSSGKNSQRETKTILHNVSGIVERGSVLAFLGPSGSGKTSLLNALAGVRNGSSILSGQILVDGKPKTDHFRRIAAFVQQDDCLLPTLTVRECIEYSAFLRLPKYMSRGRKLDLVQNILLELNLDHVQHTRIGTSGNVRGVSGGERRRVSIGMELVTSPQILFLDEPTSGLDSSSANSIVQLIKNLADHGRTIIMSIHQPSAKSLKAIDNVLILANGRVMYKGNPDQAGRYFEQAGFSCPKNESIADFMLDTVSDASNFDTLVSFSEQAMFLKSEDSDDMDVAIMGDDDVPRKMHRRSFTNDLQILFTRTGRTILRNRSLLFMHLVLSIFLGVIGGFIFQRVTNDLAGFQNRTGAFYFILTFFGFASFSSMDVFISERTIFVREVVAEYYGPFPYFLAKIILDTVSLRILPSTIFASIFYWIMGLQATTYHFLLFLTTLVLFNIAAGSISICISIASKDVGSANLISTVLFLIMLLFGGFLLNIQSMPPNISWIRYLSIFNYAFEVLMTNELQGLILNFNAPGYPSIPIYGEEFLRTLGMNIDNQIYDLVALSILIFGSVSISYCILLLQIPSKRTCSSNQTNSIPTPQDELDVI